MLQLETSGGLALTLVPVASDPAQAETLYRSLRDYCHTVRNRLNGLKITLYLASQDASGPDRDALSDLEHHYQGIERFVDQLQMIYRPLHLDPMSIHLGTMLEDRREAWASRMDLRGMTLRWLPPRDEPRGRFDPIRLIAALDAFVTWRAEVGTPGGTAHVSWRFHDGTVAMAWEEPPSFEEPELAHEDIPPASLALPILARVVAAHEGRLVVDEGDGFRVRIRLPIDPGPA